MVELFTETVGLGFTVVTAVIGAEEQPAAVPVIV
jgi:hypothetical protein